MEQGKLPRLTKDQLKRFHGFLIKTGYVKTSVQARKVTDSPLQCQKTFLQVIDYINFKYNSDDIERLVSHFSLADIFDLYIVDDELEEANHTHDKSHLSPNCISDKVSDSLSLSNCISDKVVDSANSPNQIYDKGLLVDDKGLSNQIYDKGDNEGGEPSNHIYDKGQVRGKQKQPLKVPFLLRLDSVQHERLKGLGGNTSEHIRQAIGLYLDSVQNQTV